MEAITDPYTVDRVAEQLLRQLATEHASHDIEAYWILWILFHHLLQVQSSVRSMFVENFLLWKVFPVRCLRWILQFSVLEYSPLMICKLRVTKPPMASCTQAERVAAVWSKRDFVQSAPLEQQAYACTSALDCKSASNPFGYTSEFSLVDPDEIIHQATLNYESASDENDDDNASQNSDSSDSSLQPYDLTDDDTDLKRKFSQLVDVVGALRKSDDADGVERALDVAESLIRASPDELAHLAGDLARTLVQVRCSDAAVEGEEESAEEKRQRALIAIVVMRPFESLDTLNKLLYSPNVDVSQRIMILDVMTLAAEELANTKTMKPKHQTGPLISTISEPQLCFLPSNTGPPGAGSWKQVSDIGTLLNWSNRYERELPLKGGHVKRGKTRRWSLRSGNLHENQIEWSQNKFPLYAAAFMLPAMQGFDKKRQGVDLLGRFSCPWKTHLYARCLEVSHHKEAYVRRAVLFAASCVLVSLHPPSIASSLVEGNIEISEGLEWIRTWALHVADSDTDRECYTVSKETIQISASVLGLPSLRSTPFKNIPMSAFH
ncbi:electron transfer flavoprotein-ubiquinone oxidoreductase [Hibiscus syriacus]|uniref:Electron transfer flavoprotein-ubiquinone oxidoreductase n=1 Tax=Hibiscus syriacus TaxID=106335 RepID=A0A6A2WQX5_HIBSY|nr:electron transfer flavoprotein-ubiquinone oxidoreductase [Hibiscus syriacus]